MSLQNSGGVLRLLKELYAERDDDRGVPTDDLVASAVDVLDMSEEDAEVILDGLRRRGEVYEPEPDNDRLKPTDAYDL